MQDSFVTAEGAGPEEAALQGAERSSPAPVRLDLAELGPPDLVMLGSGWSIPVHRQVFSYSATMILLRMHRCNDSADNPTISRVTWKNGKISCC